MNEPNLELPRRRQKITSNPSDLHEPRPQLAEAIENWRPFYEDRIIVKRVAPQLESKLIVLPNEDIRKHAGNQIGIVVAIGLGNSLSAHKSSWGALLVRKHPRHPMNVKVGDLVLYARVPPQEFEIDGELYCFLFEEQHCLAILEESQPVGAHLGGEELLPVRSERHQVPNGNGTAGLREAPGRAEAGPVLAFAVT